MLAPNIAGQIIEKNNQSKNTTGVVSQNSTGFGGSTASNNAAVNNAISSSIKLSLPSNTSGNVPLANFEVHGITYTNSKADANRGSGTLDYFNKA